MKHYTGAVIPGDGIGNEVIPASLNVLNAITLNLSYTRFDYSCELYMNARAEWDIWTPECVVMLLGMIVSYQHA